MPSATLRVLASSRETVPGRLLFRANAKTRKDAWQFWDTLKALKCRPPSIGQQIEVQTDAIQKIVLDLTPDQEYIYEPDIGS